MTILNSFMAILSGIQLKDILEIIIISFLFYKVVRAIKDSRVVTIIKGLAILFMFYVVAYIMNLTVITSVFQWLAYWGGIVLIMVFQTDIRRFLEHIGTSLKGVDTVSIKNMAKLIFSKEAKNNIARHYFNEKTIDELSDSCFKMGKVKTGALIVLERDIPIDECIKTGIEIGAVTTSQLLINIFEKNTPLHDGAVVIKDDKIVAATCYLPLSTNMQINKNLGTRHRAAIGMTENSDALVIVVSEETGNVSIAINGKIKYNLTEDCFKKILAKEGTAKNKITLKKKQSINELFPKIYSILLGFLCWFIVIGMSDPTTYTIYKDVPVQIINESIVNETGQAYEILSGDTVTVKITDRRSILNTIDSEDIKVIADMKKMSFVYAIPLEAKINNVNNTTSLVEIIGNQTMTIELEELVSSEIPVTIETVGELKDGLYIKEFVPEIQDVSVTSSVSISKTLNEARVTIDLSKITENTNTLSVEPIIYDNDGNVLDSKKCKVSTNKIDIDINKHPVKTIPIKINISNSDEEFIITSIESNPSEIYIAGKESNLEKINELSLELPVKFDSNTLNYFKTINVEDFLPEDIYLAQSNNKININIILENAIEKEFMINKNKISLKNLGNGLIAEIENINISLILSGTQTNIDNVSEEDIVSSIDLKGLKEGEYNLLLQFDSEQFKGLKIKQTPSVNINITKEETEE